MFLIFEKFISNTPNWKYRWCRGYRPCRRYSIFPCFNCFLCLLKCFVLKSNYPSVLLLFIVQNGELPSDAGAISGAIKQMFDILEAQNAEHNMKVTLLELYNEEIMDGVPLEKTVKSEDDKSKSSIALMEDWEWGFHC
ncbi:hypothetical protein AHAS_Ahas13G0446900 [Arachis hypogaea]